MQSISTASVTAVLHVGDDAIGEADDRCDVTSSPAGKQSFWRKLRLGDSPAVNHDQPQGSGGSGGSGRRVWMMVTRVFGRSATPRVPDVDVVKQSTTPDSSHSFNVDEVVKSKSLPLVRSTLDDDRPRYSPSPSVRRANAVRSPCTPPPAVRRPVHAPSPPASSRLAWESLRTPAGRPDEVPPSPGTPSDAQRAGGQQPAVSSELLPEPEYLYRRFVDESTTQDTTSETDDVDEGSIHDILDGYHSEDNIDDQ